MPTTEHEARELLHKADASFGDWEAEYAEINGHDGLLPEIDHDSLRPVQSKRGFILSHHGKRLRVLYENADSFAAAPDTAAGTRAVIFRRQRQRQTRRGATA